MTLIDEIKIKCSVCEKKSSQQILLSSNQMGYQDLDTRPAPMYRNTMETWAMECPHCGYVATDLEDYLIIGRNYLNCEKYITCDGLEFKSKLSERFYRQYLIETEKMEDTEAFYAILHCAWTCDDAKDEKNSKLTRKTAIRMANKIIQSDRESASELIVIKADLLRRTCEFDSLIKEYEKIKLKDELFDKIIKFQIEKAQKKDSACYTLRDVI